MTEEDSARLGLPLLAPGQAQKELWHNEALALLDIAVQAVVEEVGRDAPPGAPQPGQCWIVGAAPTGDWTGHARMAPGERAGGGSRRRRLATRRRARGARPCRRAAGSRRAGFRNRRAERRRDD